MTGRERVLEALNFSPPDILPFDFGGHRSSGISALAYSRLKKELGIRSGHIYVYDMIQQLAIIEDPVLDAFNIDTIELGRGYNLHDNDWKDWVLPDGTACKIPAFIHVEKQGSDWMILSGNGKILGRQKKGVLYFEQSGFPMADRDFENDPFDDLEEQMKLGMWTSVPVPGSHLNLEGNDLVKLEEGAMELRKNSNRAIIGLFGGNLFETPQFLFGAENYLGYMVMYPDAILRLSDKLCNIYCRNIIKWLQAVGPNIDIMLFGDDLGSNTGPLFDPAMYREYYKPFHRKMWTLVKQLAPHVKILLHSCGGIEPFLEDLIDAGLDAVNPVQISCKDMNLHYLKEKYQGKITLWGGGCDTQHILPHAAPDEIRDHVRKQISPWKGSGGYVFQQVHNITADVPVENIIALLESAHKYRQ
jgi:uroporphyrinogen decarboxylase